MAVGDFNLIVVRGTPESLRQLATVAGFRPEDHGQLELEDNLWQVSGFATAADTPGLVAEIRALGGWALSGLQNLPMATRTSDHLIIGDVDGDGVADLPIGNGPTIVYGPCP